MFHEHVDCDAFKSGLTGWALSLVSLHVFHEHVDCDFSVGQDTQDYPSLHVFHEHVDCDMSFDGHSFFLRAFTCSMSTWIATVPPVECCRPESLHVFHEHVDCDPKVIISASPNRSLHVFHEHVDCDV